MKRFAVAVLVVLTLLVAVPAQASVSGVGRDFTRHQRANWRDACKYVRAFGSPEYVHHMSYPCALFFSNWPG